MHGNIEITEIEMKEAKEITHHPQNEHKTLGKASMRKNSTKRQGLCSALFFLVMKWKYKERRTHYWCHGHYPKWLRQYPNSFVMLQYPTLKCSTQLWNNNNIIRMEPLPILVAQYLKWHDSRLGLRLGILHTSTLD